MNFRSLLLILAFVVPLTFCISEPPEPVSPHPAPEPAPPWDAVPYAFVFAAQEGMNDSVRAYLQAGVDVNVRAGGTTALIMAARFGHLETVELLLQEGADPFVTPHGPHNTGSREATALVWAQREGHEEIVEVLSLAMATGDF